MEQEGNPVAKFIQLIEKVLANINQLIDRDQIPFSIRVMLRIVTIVSQFPNRDAFLQNYDFQKNRLVTVTK